MRIASTLLALTTVLHLPFSVDGQVTKKKKNDIEKSRLVKKAEAEKNKSDADKNTSDGEEKNVEYNVAEKDKTESRESKERGTERQEIQRLKELLLQNDKYGVSYLFQYLYGMNSTAWDYLILGDSFLKILYNLGYTADNLNLLKYVGEEKREPAFSIGYVQDYTKVPTWLLRGGTAIEVNNYAIDSNHVDIFLGGFAKNIEKRKKDSKNTDSISIPKMPMKGYRKENYNYKLGFDFVESFLQQNRAAYDITKREFAKDIPLFVKDEILKCFDGNDTIRIPYPLTPYPSGGTDISSLMDYKSGTMFSFHVPIPENISKDNPTGNTEYLLCRFGPDVYYTATNKNIRGAGLWYNAFTGPLFDTRCKGVKGSIPHLMLHYGKEIMPTQLPHFTEPSRVTGYKPINHPQQSNNDFAGGGMSGYFVNGIFIDEKFVPYECLDETLALDDEGIMTHVIIVRSLIERKKLYAMYVFCGNKYLQVKKVQEIKNLKSFVPYLGPHDPKEGGNPGQTLLESLGGVSILKYLTTHDTTNLTNPGIVKAVIKKSFEAIEDLKYDSISCSQRVDYLSNKLDSLINELSMLPKEQKEKREKLKKEIIKIRNKKRKNEANLVAIETQLDSEINSVDAVYDILWEIRESEITAQKKTIEDLEAMLKDNEAMLRKSSRILADSVSLATQINVLKGRLFNTPATDIKNLQKLAREINLLDARLSGLDVDNTIPLDSIPLPGLPKKEDLQFYKENLMKRLDAMPMSLSYRKTTFSAQSQGITRIRKDVDEQKTKLKNQEKRLKLLIQKRDKWLQDRKTIPLDPDVTEEEFKNNKIE